MAFRMASTLVFTRREREKSVSPGCTMYTIQFKGGPQLVGLGVSDAVTVTGTPVSVASVVGDAGTPVSVADVVGDAAGAAVAGLLVSVAGVVGEGEASTRGEGVAVGRCTTT